MSLCNALLIKLFHLEYALARIYSLHSGYVLMSTSYCFDDDFSISKTTHKDEKFHFTNRKFTRLLSLAYLVSMHSWI